MMWYDAVKASELKQNPSIRYFRGAVRVMAMTVFLVMTGRHETYWRRYDVHSVLADIILGV